MIAKNKFGSKWCDFSEWQTEKPRDYIVMNDAAEVFSGLRAGYPVFSSDFNVAKPLKNSNQFKTLERVYPYPLHKEYI